MISRGNDRRDGATGRFAQKHGHFTGDKPTPTYRSWDSMWSRARRPSKCGRYNGVKVCERWESFENFLADMGERPGGQTLDRINPFGDYTPDNCRWATPAQQQRNRRKTVLTEEDAEAIRNRRSAGERGVDLAKEYGISQQLVCCIYKGRLWRVEE